MLFLYILFGIVILMVFIFAVDELFIRGKKRKKTWICYHTMLDCENCMNASDCKQTKGPGLIIEFGNKGDG